MADTAGYVECAFGPPDPQGERRRQRLRRRLYRDLSVVRSEFQRALTEPPPTGTRAAAWWPLVVATERIVDATTAARVRINHGAEPPAGAEVAAVAGELRELAEAVRASAPAPTRPPTAPPAPPEGVLAPLRQEVAAARAVASSAAVRV